MGDIFFVHLYLDDMSQFQSVNAAYCSFFGINPPSRACIQVDLSMVLPPADRQAVQVLYPAVMLDCFVHIGSGASLIAKQIGGASAASTTTSTATVCPAVRREVLHVRSLSEWAPVCIGPYSQANVTGGLVFVAGQIGLDPASMKMVQDARGSVHETAMMQLELSLAHVSACLKALKSDVSCALVYTVYISAEAAICAGCTEVLQRLCDQTFSSTPTPVSVYAVVPFLPRNAMVEVEVMACESTFKAKICSATRRSGKFNVCSVSFSGNVCLCSCSVFAPTQCLLIPTTTPS